MEISQIGVDIMGCDTTAENLAEAVINSSALLKNCRLHVYAAEHSRSSIEKILGNVVSVDLIFSEEEISPHDPPLQAIRQKRNSSLVKGIEDLKNGKTDAFISCGNTGALIAQTTISLKLTKGIRRPALLATLPAVEEKFVVVDVGGNVECTEEQMLQFALMGASYSFLAKGKRQLKVGLLNIGTEDVKGTALHRDIHKYLREHIRDNDLFSLEYIGNIEAHDAFSGNVDVVVTDGFTGNIFLKTAEATADLIFSSAKNLAPDLANRDLDTLKSTFDFAEYPGAVVAGAEKLVMKCHGRSQERALLHAILGTKALIKKKFSLKIGSLYQEVLSS